jgi:alanine dehydrogenase
MRIGIPREVKDGEARVGATPETVRSLVEGGHEVWIEAGAGDRVGLADDAFRAAGGRVVSGPDEIWASPLVVKVKELQPQELPRLRRGCLVFGFQQLARDPRLLDAVLAAGVTCVAYEAVTSADGGRPLLAPMSTIAGLLSAPIAAWALQRREGPLSGSGVLLAGLEGVPPAEVLVLGAGVAGQASARAFLGAGSTVTLLGREASPLEALAPGLAARVPGTLRTAAYAAETLPSLVAAADVIVGAVAVPGRLSPKLVTRPMLRAMRPGSVLVDIGIDMGGVAETSRQTKLSDPVYVEEGVLHYCVPNVPALVPRAATQALTAATLPFVRLLADLGLSAALRAAPGLRAALLVHDGAVVHAALAEDTGRELLAPPP